MVVKLIPAALVVVRGMNVANQDPRVHELKGQPLNAKTFITGLRVERNHADAPPDNGDLITGTLDVHLIAQHPATKT